YRGMPIEGGMMKNVLTYTDERASSMISTAIAYLVMGSGQSGDSSGVLRNPLSQSTMQLIGRTEQFPDELAQLLREDFLLKFSNYAGRVDQEMNLVPDEFWIETPIEETEKLEKVTRDVRLEMRDSGFYDATMLRIARKVRCRFNPEKAECVDPIE
ncbi:MAG: putative solute-binding protein, partial [Thalassolituus sp.]